LDICSIAETIDINLPIFKDQKKIEFTGGRSSSQEGFVILETSIEHPTPIGHEKTPAYTRV
jgi:hypothetical protein